MNVRVSSNTMLPRDRSSRTRVTGPPPELLAQSEGRLRILALQFAFVFFMSDPLILFPGERVAFLSSALRWAPSAASITTALLVVTLTYSRRVDITTVLGVGLVFEVGSFGMEITVQHAQAKPVPPSQRTELKIPDALDQLILDCLEKNPDKTGGYLCGEWGCSFFSLLFW